MSAQTPDPKDAPRAIPEAPSGPLESELLSREQFDATFSWLGLGPSMRDKIWTFFEARAAAIPADADTKRLEALTDAVDRACNALTDSINVSGNDAATNMQWVRKLRAAAQSNAGTPE